ncbi:2OG-Fe(II) oxygenase family protein [Nocardia asiatica]|uniref:2OG-Fe(II) oxygenase family protein n=1 Tax=Nocardia asiatica TaxID=209252 RepID=UPI00068720B4|nr:2OG-Fe(II) oxygenase family protein [Nocardia asiatica]
MVTSEPGLATPPVPQWFGELFAHRRWIRRSHPFPHVYARDVFVPEFYQRLADELRRVRRERPGLFETVAAGYSADGIRLADLRDGPLGVFSSREWHDLVARLGAVEATGDIEGSVHHHEPGSPFGWPHNDLNPAWFPGPPPDRDDVRLPDGTVDIKTGARAPGVVARETVRAVAVLFYLGNPGWQPGDGGETALYDHVADGAALPSVVLVPPLDNSLLLFEVTPRSWHTFAGNNVRDRNSVVMWVHRTRADAERRWGGDKIVHW